MDQQAIADLLQKDLGLSFHPGQRMEQLRAALSDYVNQLINEDFDKLVSLLYRMDVSEKKIRDLLQQQEGKGSAGIIADLMIEREWQKIESRKKFKGNSDIPEDEKW